MLFNFNGHLAHRVYSSQEFEKIHDFKFKYLKTSPENIKVHQFDIFQVQDSIRILTGSNTVRFFPIPLRYKGSYFFYSVAISNAQLVANYVAFELRKRNPFSEIFQDILEWKYVTNNLRGITVACSGRFRGENRTRTLLKKKGKIPLSAIRSNVDYGSATAMNRYGSVGIKIWLYYDIKRK